MIALLIVAFLGCVKCIFCIDFAVFGIVVIVGVLYERQ